MRYQKILHDRTEYHQGKIHKIIPQRKQHGNLQNGAYRFDGGIDDKLDVFLLVGKQQRRLIDKEIRYRRVKDVEKIDKTDMRDIRHLLDKEVEPRRKGCSGDKHK